MTERFVMPFQRALDDNGASISGAKLNFYLTGTTARRDTFSDRALSTPNANPVVADSAGRFSDIFLLSINYKVVLTDADSVEIWTADPVYFASVNPEPSEVYTFFDDFHNSIHSHFSSTAGGGTGNQVATVALGLFGLITMKSASDDGNHAANATLLTFDTLDYDLQQGPVNRTEVEVRLKIDDVSEAYLFVGLTDAISTTVELPIYKAAGTDNIDSDAFSAAGVVWDVDGTTQEFWHGGTAGGDTDAVHSGVAPVDDTYVVIRMVIASGAVQGFIDGVAIGDPEGSAIGQGFDHTPAVIIANRSANQVIVTIDYVWVQVDREGENP